MTRQEIQALIDAKIKGQGTAVDAGSVLPAILTGILDLIEQGGGGGTADAVQYIPQELTGAQQMQARKNQGLYYSEGGTVSSLIWDGVPSEDDIHVHNEEFGMDYYMHKMSSVPIPPSKMLGAIVSWETGGHSATITQAVVDTYESQAAQGYYSDPSAGFTVVLDDSLEEPAMGITLSRGVWFVSVVATGLSTFTKSIVLAEPYTEETIHHIEPKYIKDMYYEETTEGEIDINIPNPDEWPYSDSIYLSGMDYLRVSGETPQQSDITAIFRIEGQDTTVAGADLEIKTTGYGSKLIAYQAPDSNLAETKFLIVPEDTTIEGVSTPKGIYFPQIEMYANNHIESISFPGTITTVHQIPAKYIPSTGLEYYEIDVKVLNPQQLGSEELTGYNIQDIVDAIEGGKILVLTLRYDYGGDENPVYGKYIGAQMSRMFSTESDYGMRCIRFPAAYSYLDQTLSGHFNATQVMDIVIYEDWSQGGDEPILMIGTEDSFTNQ